MVDKNAELIGEKKLLSVKEVANFLQVPINTVYFWVHCSTIPYLKVGRHLRFETEAILKYFKQKTEGSRASETCFNPDSRLDSPSLRWSLKTRVGTVAESCKRNSNGNH